MDVAVVDDAAAVAAAEGIEGFIEAGLLFIGCGHDAGDGSAEESPREDFRK